ncbi:protein RGF1 INDUCIBLE TRANSCRIPTION FACTOR 1 [Physcomitrium patens]|uniref:B box-type domain-containing protein n=1 Tax=Physcomitrium patens TaxID=3218 RepID=A9RE13_PHYPA|nr:uncharacterized protein LOC112295294 [Physcomitrium patens]PNR35130.1 hypothetical protein PHYPA_023029 [Physcomitrium patens]|eukprot:XP_024402424.1 uncharacterized protein LOC112295294 [Physcomitrella patens]
MVGYDLSALPQKPAWLESLLAERFFVPCAKHGAFKKNERNVFCVDCNAGVCQHCVPDHQNHCILQIRRYVYHDVIRLQDMQRLLDCSTVQTYIINSARVVFLNQRPQPRPSKGLGNACGTCDRSLQDSYAYCSVACKVDAVVSSGKDLSTLLPESGNMPYSFFTCSPTRSLKGGKHELEDELLTDSLCDGSPTHTSSASTGSEGIGFCGIVSTASTQLLPKKVRSGRISSMATSPKSVIFPVSVKRRKGTPHRSPFC